MNKTQVFYCHAGYYSVKKITRWINTDPFCGRFVASNSNQLLLNARVMLSDKLMEWVEERERGWQLWLGGSDTGLPSDRLSRFLLQASGAAALVFSFPLIVKGRIDSFGKRHKSLQFDQEG